MTKGLQVEHLIKHIDGNKILDDISFSAIPGKVLALVGPSGSGKTTLLKTINRLIEFDEGSIRLNDQSIKDMDPIDLRRCAGMVLQMPVMFDGTVKQNIEYGLKLRNNHQKNDQRILQALKDAGLPKKFLYKNAQKLSGGEQQRVALARTLVLEPDVLLLDEPTAALDPKLMRKIEATILRLCKSRNLIILWVTHNHTQARRVGDKIGILDKGKLRLIKTSSKSKYIKIHKNTKPKGGI